MPDSVAIGAWLLVLGPVIGAIPVGNPSLVPIWSMSREDHLARVGAHRLGWALLNAGFVLATTATTAALVLVAAGVDREPARSLFVVGVVAYLMGGVLWCAVLAARSRTTVVLADLVGSGEPTEPAEAVVGVALGGLFAWFVVLTGAALVAVGAACLAVGIVAWPVAGLAILVGLFGIGWLARTGDVIPAVLYLPTLALGIALLAGWN